MFEVLVNERFGPGMCRKISTHPSLEEAEFFAEKERRSWLVFIKKNPWRCNEYHEVTVKEI